MKRNPKKFERCVRAVKKRGGARNAYAVCSSLRSNPGELEFDTSKAAQQYKRLVEAEGATGVRISRRGHKHVVKWNPRGPRRPKPKKIPKKVLESHRRIWGGTIPPGALEMLRREFTSSPRGNPKRKKKVNGRRNGAFTIRKTPDGDYALRLRGELLGVFANRQTAEKYQRIEQQARKNPGRRNPVEAAREKYEEFHGRPSEDLIEVDTPMHVHDVLSGIGTLVKLVVLSTNGKWRVNLTKFKGTLVAQNEDSEKMPQLYFEGGDQEVNLEDFGITDPVHEFEELGRMEWIYYHTVKDHLGDDGGDAVYKHKLRRIKGGKRGREKPVVIYDVRNKLLSIAGGAYTILPEGIEN